MIQHIWSTPQKFEDCKADDKISEHDEQKATSHESSTTVDLNDSIYITKEVTLYH